MVVYVNKMDFRHSADMRELVELEVRDLLETYGFPGATVPFIFGSARTALEEVNESELGSGSVYKLMNIVDEYVQQPMRKVDASLILAIEGVLVAKGRGTVVTGKVEQGKINLNDELEVIGHDVKKTECLGLEMFRRSLDYAEVGENVGVLIRGIKKDEISRGFVLAAPGTIKPYEIFRAKIYLLTKEEGGRRTGFGVNYKPQFFFRTANVTGAIQSTVEVNDISFIMPGDSADITVTLVNKIPLTNGLRFVMREGNITVGAGVVFKLIN